MFETRLVLISRQWSAEPAQPINRLHGAVKLQPKPASYVLLLQLVLRTLTEHSPVKDLATEGQ